jgi:hypothetical protein
MLPVLRRLVAEGPATNTFAGDIALHRLFQLAPAEGRAAILASIASPRAGATLKTLGSLPDRELPALDDRLAANVGSASGFEDLSIRAELLQRYATAAVASRVFSAVGGKLDAMACQPKTALLAYFLRVDPKTGLDLVNRALAVRQGTACYTTILTGVAKLAMAPPLEAIAIAHLEDPSPAVVGNAAEMLGRYGSPAALPSLRAAFERWHAAWVGRADLLRQQPMLQSPEVREHSTVEWRLLEAIVTGAAWLTAAPEIEAVRGWCVSDNCVANAGGMIERSLSRRINVVYDPDQVLIIMAQYELESMAAFERKLAQFPRGTTFHVEISASSPALQAEAADRVRRAAAAHGIKIE